MLAKTKDELNSLLEKASRTEVLAVDTEGYFEFDNKTLDTAETVGLSFAGPGFETYIPFNHFTGGNFPGEWLNSVVKMLNDHPCMVFHNAKHDLTALERLGISVRKFYDTMLMAHWVDENIPNKSLDYLSRMFGGQPKNRDEVMDGIIKLLGWAYVDVPRMHSYATNDARITWDLFYKLYPEFQSQGFDGELWDIEQDFTRLLRSMEQQGICIDVPLVEQEIERGEKRMAEIRNELGCNPSSPIELSKLLLDDLGLPPIVRAKSKTGKPSFDKAAMEIYDELLSRRGDERARLVREYRGWQITTGLNYKPYLDRLSSDGRLRCNYKMHGTETTRLSCSNPNLQQIPRTSSYSWNGKLKKAFIGSPGFRLYEGDFKQLEFRLGAAYGREQRLLEIFSDSTRDIFQEIAADVCMARQDVKTLTYTIQFGGGVNRISEVFGVSFAAAKAIRDGYYKKYPGLLKASQRAAMVCRDKGYITLWSGRRRHFPNPEEEARIAFNAAIQGGAAEIVKRTLLRLKSEGILNNECRLLLQIHDSGVFEIAEGKEETYLPEIQRVMEAVVPDFGVKFAVDVHEWGK